MIQRFEHSDSANGAGDFRVAVVGGGIGGLSASIALASKGHAVTLYEAQEAVGGKMRRVAVGGGQALDAGPTVLTMRGIFDSVFTAAGQSLDDFVQLRPLDRLARHWWADGSQFDLYNDEARSAEEIRATFGPKDAAGYLRFVEHARSIYRRVEGPFIHAPKPGVAAAWQHGGPFGVLAMLGVDWHRSMWRAIGSFFESPKLRQLFGRYATYYGSSPFAAPATLNLIAEVEREGVWSVVGGMHNLAQAMAKLADQLGVEIRTHCPVQQLCIAQGRVTGLVADRGEETYDAVVFNGAVEALEAGYLGEAAKAAVRRRKAPPRSLSAVTWCMATPTQGVDLDFHNVFFSDDYKAEFDALFGRGELPAEPTVYVCAQDRDGAQSPPPRNQAERIFVLANAPARGDEQLPNSKDIETCERATFELMQRCGLELSAREQAICSGPTTFEGLFPGTGGALYGPATHGPFAAFSRPTARTKIAGLYVAGGTAHPGAGVPMVALSGQMAADAIGSDASKLVRRSTHAQLSTPTADLDSTSKSPPAAMRGGTSTPSTRPAPAR